MDFAGREAEGVDTPQIDEIAPVRPSRPARPARVSRPDSTETSSRRPSAEAPLRLERPARAGDDAGETRPRPTQRIRVLDAEPAEKPQRQSVLRTNSDAPAVDDTEAPASKVGGVLAALKGMIPAKKQSSDDAGDVKRARKKAPKAEAELPTPVAKGSFLARFDTPAMGVFAGVAVSFLCLTGATALLG